MKKILARFLKRYVTISWYKSLSKDMPIVEIRCCGVLWGKMMWNPFWNRWEKSK